MSPHIDRAIGPLEVEQLPPEQKKEVLAHIHACEHCSREFGKAAEALAALGLAPRAVQPTAGLRDRILFDASRSNRFEPLVDRAARIVDVGAEKMSSLLAKIDDPSSWKESPLKGVAVFPLQGGPASADAIVRFIKIKPGSTFPEHSHLGDETVLVLQGSCLETSSGRTARRGDVVEMARGTQHSVVALPGPDFVYLAVARRGITMFGTTILPGDSDA